MKLPYKMGDTVLEALYPFYEARNIKPYFAAFFVKAFKDEEGNVVHGAIAPRYIIIHSGNKQNLDQSVFNIEKLFGKAIDYEVFNCGVMPDSRQNLEDGFILLHRRSRAREAEILNELFSTGRTEALWDHLMKSVFKISVIEENINGMKSYSAKTSILPSTADLIADSGPVVYPNPIEAFEKAVGSPYCNYEEVIDLGFDLCSIEYGTHFKGEFEPFPTNAELIKIFRMNLVAALSGKTETKQS